MTDEVKTTDPVEPEEVILTRLDELDKKRGTEISGLKDEVAVIRTAVEEIGIKTAKIAAEPKEHRKVNLNCLLHSIVTGDWKPSEFERSIVTGDEARDLSQLHLSSRDMSVGVDSAGGFLVPTAYLPERFIAKMENATVVREAGAQTLDNLTASPVVIPKMTTDATAYWIAEGGAPTESTPAVGEITLEPRGVGAFVELTDRVIRFSTPSAMTIVQDSMAGAIGRAIDLQALFGPGAVNVPVGVRYAADVGATTMNANPDKTNLRAMIQIIVAQNELKGGGRFAWIMSERTWDDIANLEDANGRPLYAITMADATPKRLLGYPVFTTVAIPNTVGGGSDESTIFFGNWSQLTLASWQGLQFKMSDSHASNFTKGIRAVVATALVDFSIGRGQAFVYDEQVRSD